MGGEQLKFQIWKVVDQKTEVENLTVFLVHTTRKKTFDHFFLEYILTRLGPERS